MFRFSNQPIVSSKFVFGVGNFGVLFDDVPVTGENGPSVLLNDGGVSGQYVRLRIVDIAPTITSLFVYENGSFESEGYGDWTYYDSKNGVENTELSTVTINQFSSGSTMDIVSAFAPMQSSLSATNTLPEYNVSVASTFAALQSAVSIVNGVPVRNASIATTLPALSSSVQMVNVAPEYNLTVISSLPSLQSVLQASYSNAGTEIGVSSTLPSLSSSITITNVVPEYTLSISSSLPFMQSNVSLVNGELIVYVPQQNLIYIKSKSRLIYLR